ncbi:MAG: protein kinase [Planctomycetota bacterium]
MPDTPPKPSAKSSGLASWFSHHFGRKDGPQFRVDESVVLRKEYRSTTFFATNKLTGTAAACKKIYVRDFSDHDRMALKRLRQIFGSPEMRRRQMEVDSPNVQRIYDCGVAYEKLFQQVFYVFCEHVEGLYDRQRKPFDYQPRVGISKNNVNLLIEIGKGLSAIHRHGLIHQEVCPDNIFLSDAGKVKVINWGPLRNTERLLYMQTMESGVPLAGVPGFLSPEQIAQGKADRRSDIYAFGILAHLIFTGSNPYAASELTPQTMKLTRDDFELHMDEGLRKHRAGRVVAACTKAQPNQRYQMMADVLKDLYILQREGF